VTAYIQEQLQAELGLGMNVHPVSSLPNHTILLDHFFERELLPRFDQARNLRNASVARKIGALRSSMIAALETTIDQTKRRGKDIPHDVHDLEEQLRLVTGEIGEQRTVLSRAFFELAETPERVLNETADSALRWMQANSNARVTPLQLSEWLHDAVWKSVQRPIEDVRSVSQRAIFTLQAVAQEMGRIDVPAPEEVESLLRDMPRFELASLPEPINMSHWMFLGTGFVRSRIRKALWESMGPLVKQELHLYGDALSRWSNQFVSKIVLLVSSYADAYRVQLQRISGTSDGAIDAPQLKQDLALLRNWNANESPDASETIEREA
jgi:hypothetical protein